MKRAQLERLYREQAPAVMRRARQILRDDDDARDALHEIFVGLAGNERFEERGGTTAWFYVRTTNYCLNRIRDAANRARLRAVHAPVAAALAPGGETSAIARDVLAHLPAELAEVAVYYYVDEMTHDEIAALLRCSRRHVGHLVERVHQHVATVECAS